MPQGWDLGGAGWVKNFSFAICDGAPSTAHSSFFYFLATSHTSIMWEDNLQVVLLSHTYTSIAFDTRRLA